MDKYAKEYFLKYRHLLDCHPPRLRDFYSHMEEHFGETDYDIFTSICTSYLYLMYAKKGDRLLNHLSYIPSYYMKNDPVNLYREVIPENIRAMGIGCYWDCTELGEVIFNSTLDVIGDGAFHGCNKLDNVNIPSNIKVISKGAFEDCYSLSTLTFNEGLESIDNYAFDGCVTLTEFTLPKSIVYFGYKALPSGPKVTVSVYHNTEGEKWAIDNNCKINYLD